MKPKKSETHYVICVKNKGCEDLTLCKLYRVMPDHKGESAGYIRVMDESGEDYLYPAGNFLPIDLPQPVERALASAA